MRTVIVKHKFDNKYLNSFLMSESVNHGVGCCQGPIRYIPHCDNFLNLSV